MRPFSSMRKARPVHVAAGAIMLTVPASAAWVAVTQAYAQGTVQIHTDAREVALGDHVRVTGQAPANDAGQPVELEYVPAGTFLWQPVRSATVAPGGRFVLNATVPKTGQLRALVGRSETSSRSGESASSVASSDAQASDPQPIVVGSRFALGSRTRNVLQGSPVTVRGRLLPAVSGRRVRLLERRGGGWTVVGTTRTATSGAFAVHFRPATSAPRGSRLRVQFDGDRFNSHALSSAGRVTVFHQSTASWYDDGGATACGFHAGLGVASPSLPCGTRVTFDEGGRTVTATVDDRGPYVGGRDWDLNQSTAAALGFSGVGSIWSTA